ncbi:hypothetical protein KIW84_053678 [Lathyrus oleraceus]|uniref:Uncharacterized protein n=1 Tax=Pisum sativum TaxID=3888 RepID=A0A9D5ADL3_PEA|nr:hypothetical protein KIW84_053678 [Pisum sativum]
MDQVKENRKQDTREEENEQEKWVHDGSVDFKGKVPLRASTGVWIASLFVLTNLISYLTKVMHEDLKTAAKNVNYWTGTTTLMPLIGGFLADAYTGRFPMVLFSSLVYLMGLSLLTLSQYIPSLKPCNTKTCLQPRKLHEVVFFLSLYCISVGTGGHKPCLESFGADQFDEDHVEERKKKMSFFNWWSFALCFALLLAFYVGKPFYRYRRPQGNTLKPILQVLVAAIRKRKLSCPSNPDLLYEVPKSDNSQGRLLSNTSNLRFLDKAAIIEDTQAPKKKNPWGLATVTRVEETKLILNIIPIWLTSLTTGICLAQGSTLFVKQAASMNLKVNDSFSIPPASVSSASAFGILIFVPIYDRVIVPIMRKITGNERGISILRRISIGIAFSVIVMIVAALVEAKRLRMHEHEILRTGETGEKTMRMSVFWLVPQYFLLGFGDAFSLIGLQEYFYDQVPDSMRSLGMALYLSVLGVGSFLGSFLIIIVDHVTEKNGKSWFGKDINSSRLDRYYWMLAIINALNLCAYIFIANRYTYKKVQRIGNEINDGKSDGVEIMA